VFGLTVADGTVYIGSHDDKVYALAADVPIEQRVR